MGNKGITITLIILLSIIVFFLVMFLVLALNGNLSFGGDGMMFGRKSDTIIVDKTYNLNEINNIEILSTAGDIKFEESKNEELRVVIYGKDENDVNIALNSNDLKIDYSKYKRAFFGFNLRINDIIVYIPNNYDGKIDIDNDYGESKLCDLESASVNIDSDCGSVELGKIKNAYVECNLGDIKADTILNKCEIKADCGNVKINNLEIKENSQIKCDLGDIKIVNAKDVFIDAKVDLGDIKIKDNNRQAEVTLEAKVDCGNIKVGM